MEEDVVWATMELMTTRKNEENKQTSLAGKVEDWLRRVSARIQPTAALAQPVKYQAPPPICNIQLRSPDRRVQENLHKLMGSEVASVTDRQYMHLLQKKMLDSYEQKVKIRIEERENQEKERQKLLRFGTNESKENLAQLVAFPVEHNTKPKKESAAVIRRRRWLNHYTFCGANERKFLGDGSLSIDDKTPFAASSSPIWWTHLYYPGLTQLTALQSADELFKMADAMLL